MVDSHHNNNSVSNEVQLEEDIEMVELGSIWNYITVFDNNNIIRCNVVPQSAKLILHQSSLRDRTLKYMQIPEC